MKWLLNEGVSPEMLGYIPSFLNPDDPRPAKEQFHEAYAHGGGWSPFSGFKVAPNGRSIQYPGDPKMDWLAMTMLGDEMIVVFPHAWVMIVQPDGSHEISRMD